MAFLVVVISLLIIYFSGAVPGIQRDGWYVSWLTYLRKSTDSGKRPKTYLTVSLLVPVGVLMVVLWFAKGLLFGLPVLVLNVLLLLYAFGREDVTSKAYVYTEALSRGDFQAAFHQAAVFNRSHHEGRARNQGELHREVLQAISYRYFEHYFAVVFWYFLLGAPAAVLYRLTQLHGDLELDGKHEKAVITRWLWLLEWLPTRLMGLTLSVVGNFSDCFRQWQVSLTNSVDSTAVVLGGYLEGAMNFGQSDSPTEQIADVESVKALYTRSLMLMVILLALVVIFV